MKPISGQYKDKKLVSCPSPASGAVWIHALGMLSNLGSEGHGTVADTHQMIEVHRVRIEQHLSLAAHEAQIAYPQRTQLGDPPFLSAVEELETRLVDPAICKERAKLVDASKTQPPDYYRQPLYVHFHSILESGDSSLATVLKPNLTTGHRT